MSAAAWRDGQFTVRLDTEVNASSIDLLLLITPIQASELTRIVLDASNVRHITAAGACYLVALFCWLASGSKYKVQMRLVRPGSPVCYRMAALGMFSQLSNMAGLSDCEDLVAIEYKTKEIVSAGSGLDHARDSDASDSSITIMPMTLVPKRQESLVALRDFNNTCCAFIHKAATAFEYIVGKRAQMSEAMLKIFWNANVELYKNVFDHSEGCGWALIEAVVGGGPIVCYHDIGIGMRASANKPRPQRRKFLKDESAIRWALVPGHTSRRGNSGTGLTEVSDMVSGRNGVLQIRSGKVVLTRRGTGDWTPRPVPALPGTHICFQLPQME